MKRCREEMALYKPRTEAEDTAVSLGPGKALTLLTS